MDLKPTKIRHIEEKYPNPDYDPKIKPNKKPKHCKGKVGIDCIKCEHLAYGEIEGDLMKKLKDVIHKHFEEDKEE